MNREEPKPEAAAAAEEGTTQREVAAGNGAPTRDDWRDVEDDPWRPDEDAPPPVIGR